MIEADKYFKYIIICALRYALSGNVCALTKISEFILNNQRIFDNYDISTLLMEIHTGLTTQIYDFIQREKIWNLKKKLEELQNGAGITNSNDNI